MTAISVRDRRTTMLGGKNAERQQIPASERGKHETYSVTAAMTTRSMFVSTAQVKLEKREESAQSFTKTGRSSETHWQ